MIPLSRQRQDGSSRGGKPGRQTAGKTFASAQSQFKTILLMHRPASGGKKDSIATQNPAHGSGMAGSPMAAGARYPLALLMGDGCSGTIETATVLYFDEGDHAAAFGDQVNLTPWGQIAPCKNAIPFQSQHCLGDPLSTNAAFVGAFTGGSGGAIRNWLFRHDFLQAWQTLIQVRTRRRQATFSACTAAYSASNLAVLTAAAISIART
jgi:hypothetical protein